MPDDELLALAGRNELSENIDVQVRRMLKDSKSSSLVTQFALQWLQIQRLASYSPDPKLFPQFDEKLRGAMRKETELFFESILKEDRSILDLIDADYTFLNETLARHYGIVDTAGTRAGEKREDKVGQRIRGDKFERVTLQSGERGGLLTQASILAVTSNPTRTSPVKRGRWVLEQILGAPPPPPPPNAPLLEEGEQAKATGTLKERLEAHRKNPSCANCHAKMDPIGFALENFDAVGAYRTKDGEFSIDATGQLADGTLLDGPTGLKKVIRERKQQFERCLVEKMLIYALGRGIEYYDRPSIDRIVNRLASQEDRISVLVTEIIKSDPFRMRRASDETASIK